MKYVEVEIHEAKWSECRICGLSVREMERDTRPGKGYYSNRFKNHVQSVHGLSLSQYFIDVEKEICRCGCGSPLPVVAKGNQIGFNRYLRWHQDNNNPKWAAGVERMKRDRVGSGNPMFGRDAWNKGLTKDSDERVNAVAEKLTGIVPSNETRMKMAKKARLRTGENGSHYGCRHSDETKNRIRQKTLEAINRGVFSHLKSKPHIAMSLILDEIGLEYNEEVRAGVYSFDFQVVESGIFIEVDGDYFHSNPEMYPDGPKSKTQKINWYRDRKKDQFCTESGLRCIRVWENDILRNRAEVVCRLRHETRGKNEG